MMRENDTATGSAGTDEGEPELDDETAAELSRAAREAVRQPADPRIDRQLARMGLAPAPDETEPASPPGRAPARPTPSEAELARLRTEVETAHDDLAVTRSALARTRGRLDLLTWVVTFEGIAIAILAVLLLVR